MLEHLKNHFAPLPKLQAFHFTRYDIVARMETFLEDSEYVIHRYFSIKYNKGFDFIGLLDYQETLRCIAQGGPVEYISPLEKQTE